MSQRQGQASHIINCCILIIQILGFSSSTVKRNDLNRKSKLIIQFSGWVFDQKKSLKKRDVYANVRHLYGEKCSRHFMDELCNEHESITPASILSAQLDML